MNDDENPFSTISRFQYSNFIDDEPIWVGNFAYRLKIGHLESDSFPQLNTASVVDFIFTQISPKNVNF